MAFLCQGATPPCSRPRSIFESFLGVGRLFGCLVVCWLVGRSDVWLVGWLGWLIGWLVTLVGRLFFWLIDSTAILLIGWLLGRSVGCLLACLLACLFGWLVGWLVSWLLTC